ncbi:SpoIIE family protein phosphatase [Nocardioides zeae]|uniref:SpoIIE family protein phosphatase n=1 Tax=Nocardioides imazamoxiresistens TaxID=3231893 RepID=A0ABU3Q1J0_9ACTN|nr:GAF domain-containing SpoIIE family protein phosphatase [Nocardioides zeae]MDT9594996.1 SpoIIE family protein phosphatase [Nocardioides zeae]
MLGQVVDVTSPLGPPGAQPSGSRFSSRLRPVADGDPALRAVLERTRAQLGSQTATVLLLDETSGKLHPVAAVGFGRRWRTASLVSIGQGFAGRVASTRRPLSVDRTGGDPVVNPVLRASPVVSLLGVPLLDGDRVVGVLHVGFHDRRAFDAGEVAQLEEAGAELVRALAAGAFHEAQAAALALQRSLLPTLHDVDGLELAARYLPADGELGGDWYDVMELPDDRVGIVMGDVMGHGLHAAVVMGRLRSALRAYALDDEDPAVVLHRLDRMLCHFEAGTTATVLYVVARPPFTELRFSCAGHLAPVRARTDGHVRRVDLEPDVLLGMDPTAPRSSSTLALAPGESLAMFTDGLVEMRRTGGVDPYWEQLERIERGFSAADHPELACSRILTEAVGDETTDDDIALLVMRRTAAG